MDDNISLQRTLGRIEGKIDALHDRMAAFDERAKQVEDHETRLTVIETEQKSRRFLLRNIAAWVGALAGSAGIAWDLITQVGGHH